MPNTPRTLKRKVSYSLSVKIVEEIERLSELRQLPRSIIVQLAVERYAKDKENQQRENNTK